MSREDQVNLNSYANKLISSISSFQDSMPLESLGHIRLNSLNRLLPYLGAQELTIQGRGVLSQPRILTLLLDGGGNPTWSQVGANWPCHIIYGQLTPFGCSMALMP